MNKTEIRKLILEKVDEVSRLHDEMSELYDMYVSDVETYDLQIRD